MQSLSQEFQWHVLHKASRINDDEEYVPGEPRIHKSKIGCRWSCQYCQRLQKDRDIYPKNRPYKLINLFMTEVPII